MNDKPLILLDIDGVISPNGRIDENIETRTIKNKYGRWAIPLLNLKFIKALSELAEVVWLSTWQEHSNAINKHIGINNFNCTSNLYKSNKLSINQIKLDEIEHIRRMFPDRLIFVVDDEINSPFANFNVKPDSLVGLTLQDIQNILREVKNEKDRIKFNLSKKQKHKIPTNKF